MKSMSAKDAKNGFGLLLDTARAEPVTIEKHGRPVVVALVHRGIRTLVEALFSRERGLARRGRQEKTETNRNWKSTGTMTGTFYEQPILNSPYAEPTRHHALDEDGQPTDNPPVAGRRRSERISPVSPMAPMPDRNCKARSTRAAIGCWRSSSDPNRPRASSVSSQRF